MVFFVASININIPYMCNVIGAEVKSLISHYHALAVSLLCSSYFERVASQQGCVQCQDRVAPEEVKTAIGVCTVFLLRKTVDWITSNKQQ